MADQVAVVHVPCSLSAYHVKGSNFSVALLQHAKLSTIVTDRQHSSELERQSWGSGLIHLLGSNFSLSNFDCKLIFSAADE